MPHVLRRHVLTVEESHTPTKNIPRKTQVAIHAIKRDITVPSVSLNECHKSAVNVLDTVFLDTVRGEQTSAWFTIIKLNEQETRFKLDTGAEVTAISEQSYLSLQNPQWSTPEKALTTAPEHPWTVLGKAFAQWKGGQAVCVWGGWSQDKPSSPACHHCPGISHSS